MVGPLGSRPSVRYRADRPIYRRGPHRARGRGTGRGLPRDLSELRRQRMCGIVGYVGPRQVTSLLIEGLRRLEYRGYDSAGIAVINGKGLVVVKQPGKLSALEGLLRDETPKGTVGIGHTRWATHGPPNVTNAHP